MLWSHLFLVWLPLHPIKDALLGYEKDSEEIEIQPC